MYQEPTYFMHPLQYLDIVCAFGKDENTIVQAYKMITDRDKCSHMNDDNYYEFRRQASKIIWQYLKETELDGIPACEYRQKNVPDDALEDYMLEAYSIVDSIVEAAQYWTFCDRDIGVDSDDQWLELDQPAAVDTRPVTPLEELIQMGQKSCGDITELTLGRYVVKPLRLTLSQNEEEEEEEWWTNWWEEWDSNGPVHTDWYKQGKQDNKKEEPADNNGRTHCFKCGAATVKRQLFTSIIDICPKCNI